MGRTARIGHAGTAVTLFSPDEKLLIKKIIKTATKGVPCAQPLSRSVQPESIVKWVSKITDLEGQITKILREEHVERELRLAEMELSKVQNLSDFKDEIMSRPRKQWFGEGSKNELQVNKNSSKRGEEEAKLLSKIERADQMNDNSSDDERSEKDFLSDGDLSDEESGNFSAVESDGLESDASDDGAQEERPRKRAKKEEKANAVPEAEPCVETAPSSKKPSQRKNEKNRLRKGKEQRLTPKQRAIKSEHRQTKAIGKYVKKTNLLKQRRSAGSSSDDDEPASKRKPRSPRQKRQPQQQDKPSKPSEKKITRKMRKATKKYKTWVAGKDNKKKV